MPGLLVSAADSQEWELAIRAGVDWIDLKNPRNGPLGRPEWPIAREFALRMQRLPNRHWSIAGGELKDWDPSTDCGFCTLLGERGHLKWALAGCENTPGWLEKLAECLAPLPRASQAILVHYADYEECAAPTWHSVLGAARDNGLPFVLIDTAVKDGRSLLDRLSEDRLERYGQECRSLGIELAIAGSLRLDQLAVARRVGASWVGVRGAVCRHSDRSSSFCKEKLEQAVAFATASPSSPRRESVHVLG